MLISFLSTCKVYAARGIFVDKEKAGKNAQKTSSSLSESDTDAYLRTYIIIYAAIRHDARFYINRMLRSA